MNDLTKETTPTLLASLIDQYAVHEMEMKIHEARVASIKTELSLLENRIAEEMAVAHLRSAGGMIGLANIDRKHFYKVSPEEWPDLYAHIKATGEFDLLQRRISSTAVGERVKAGVPLPPGIGRIAVDQLSITKRKS